MEVYDILVKGKSYQDRSGKQRSEWRPAVALDRLIWGLVLV